MKKALLTLLIVTGSVVLSPFWSHAFQISTLPDSVTLNLSNATHDQIKTQKLINDAHIITTSDNDIKNSTQSYQDSVRHIMNMFYYDQFHHFQDPLAPYFMLLSKDASLALGVGGAVRLRGWYDFAGSIDQRGFSPYLIPVPSDPSQRRWLSGTPAGTAMFLRLIGRNKHLGDIVGYVQAEFSASSNAFKLKKAYVTISDWTIGYTQTAFNDPAAEAPTIDGSGQNGTAGRSALGVRWDHKLKKRWKIGAGVAMPSGQIQADNVTTKSLSDWFPDVAAYVQYGMPYDGHVRLAGMARVLPYRDLLTSKNTNKFGWGLQLSSVIYPVPRFGVFVEANTGQGYSAYMQDISIGQYDLINNPNKPGTMYAPWSLGLNLGCKYNFTDNIYAAMALAEARHFDRYGAAPDEYKYGLYGSWSIYWEPIPRMLVGGEYLHGRRNNVDHQHGSANRVDVLFQFSF